MSYRNDEPRTAFPFADSNAAIMLSEGLKRANRERRLSLRSLAKVLGYKQATVLSHMAKGRIAIPLERAPQIARAVGLPVAELLLAAVEQRSPEAGDILSHRASGAFESASNLVFDLNLIAGHSIDQLNEEQKMVLREVVADPKPTRRWLGLVELPAVMFLRELRPEMASRGLSAADRGNIETALSG